MPRSIRDFLLLVVVLVIGSVTGCTCVDAVPPESIEGGGGTGGTGGSGGEDFPCGIDCSAIETPTCTVAVCNTGQVLGALFTCVVVEAPTGSPCDDGQFCTIGESCDAGACVAEATNDCGLDVEPCEAVICSEASESCSVTPLNDGDACTPSDPCEINGVCNVGACIGEPKDCSFSPLTECNNVACDSDTGECVGTPAPNKDTNPCFLSGDLCQVEKECLAGECVGGVPKDCSGLNVACEIGECNEDTGICDATNAPLGTSCAEGITVCEIGECDGAGACKAANAPDGSDCNDHDACTAVDECDMGGCGGTSPVAGCSLYYKQGFETCPSGWTFGGDWECGVPMGVGPPAPHAGSGVLATNLDGVYSISQSFNTANATSPAISLAGATNPILSFWAYDHTEGGTFDGWNLKVSTNGGANFTTVTTVTPAYPLTISGQPAWGGNHSADGWQPYRADLTAYAGQSIILRFGFRSDGATVYPGVYIDDLVIAEPLQDPLYITTNSISDVYATIPFTLPLGRTGGTPAAVWSIVPGGTNTDWLTIDPATGVLSGTPTGADAGPVTLTVRIAEPSFPTNYDEKTFIFGVDYAAYFTSFEGTCPAGWTLTGTWQCGVPTNVGPDDAFAGTQCIATNIAGNYANNQSYAGATASSPSIDLSGSAFPTLTFRMWIDTEGSTRDGGNLKISTDGGANWEVVDTVDPPYTLTVAGEPAWGGHQDALGWQLVTVNLAAYAGQTVRLRFSFRSDGADNYPGIYVDDFLVQ